jgi:hypothetical protein
MTEDRQICSRNDTKWFARPILEEKDEAWKEEILEEVKEVPTIFLFLHM